MYLWISAHLLFLPMDFFFLPFQCLVLNRNTCLTLGVFPVYTSQPAYFYHHVIRSPKANTAHSFSSLLHCPYKTPIPLITTSLCSSPSTNLWSHLNSVHTFRCVKDSLFTLYGAFVLIKCTRLTPFSPRSFNLYSNLSAALRRGETWDSTSHKSSQIFYSFYQQMVWLPFCNDFSPSLHAGNLQVCISRWNPVLMFVSQLEFAYQLRCCKSNWRSATPDMDAINQRVLETRSSFCFFLA